MMLGLITSLLLAQQPAAVAPAYKTIEITLRSQDGQELFGKLTMPEVGGRRPVVVMIQTAEAQTADQKVQGPRGPLEFHDLYRRELAAIGVAFFSYEGRGIRAGTEPPRFVAIDRTVYNTSTIENKVLDAIAAVRALRARSDIDASNVWLTGVSEGTLLAAETASRIPKEIMGLVLSSVMTTLPEAIKFMMTDGAYLQHLSFWDGNGDGRITADEFETDRRGVRRSAKLEFKMFDFDGDGVYTMEERRVAAKSALAAVDAADMTIVGAWLKASAGLETPEGWLKDHFAHRSTWAFLSQLDIPVGVFHGDADGNTPVEGVRGMERLAASAGKTKMEFHYYPRLNHSLGGLDYFMRGAPSDAYKEMFAYIKRQTSR